MTAIDGRVRIVEWVDDFDRIVDSLSDFIESMQDDEELQMRKIGNSVFAIIYKKNSGEGGN